MAKSKRVQIRVSDIYRYIVTGETCIIDGILQYIANKQYICVKYEGSRRYTRYKAYNEDLRRLAVKNINKRIGEI